MPINTLYYCWYSFPVLLFSIDGNVRILINGSLYIESMREEYYGVYVCWASNEAGTTEASVVIARSGKAV